ncbi:hypothetical protein EK21DRAFT_93737 [Setomelanomma holmii]|uniref:DUF7924 domain-containing protein n=1 Tax=Setomelanomma holmii TaxID=210430 RepID=A0A9P4LH45_9PLEO|nr:hypothetical protein EK21DRAFT_93737 [Setomelanomma holmii]
MKRKNSESACTCVSTLTPPSASPTTSCFHFALQGKQGANPITTWIHDVNASQNHDEPTERFPVETCSVPDNMSDSSRLRQLKTARRSRSCSPTKKSSQYRSVVLKPVGILVDVIHNLPPDIEALLPRGLRDVLDRRAPLLATAYTQLEDTSDKFDGSYAWTRELADKVSQIASVYRHECCELAEKPGSEPEYRSHLYGDVVEKLARFPSWRRALRANCSDKSWLTTLKPPAPTRILSLPWPSLPINPGRTKLQEHASFASTLNSFDSNIIHVQPDSDSTNLASLTASTEPSDSSSVSDLDSTITTPKPDITVGISRDAFTREQTGLLEYWQASKLVLSDPHATQGDMRFPFLIIEAKGLATDGNLIGAQNQAAGGGTCAIRLLASLAEQDSEAAVPRIVFSCTTEGAIHELWIHFTMLDEENNPKQHMVCLGAWRMTIERHVNEFVTALAIILSWGVDVFFPQIKQVLDGILNVARSAR